MENNFIMTQKDVLLAEFNHEMVTTRKILERVPFEKFDWVPHPKSTPLGRLAVHIATLAGMGARVIENESLSFDGPGPQPEIKSTADIIALFDKNSSASRNAIENTTDEKLSEMWRLQFRDKVIFEGPRALAMRTLMMNHIIHHRAQLGVFLRLNDIAIPGSYGPSADEAVR